MSTHYRPAAMGDAANLAALSAQVWLHTYARSGLRHALSNYVLTELTEGKFLDGLQNDRQMFIVCETDVHLVGYIRLDFDAPCPSRIDISTEIMTLYVQAHFLRRGIGAGLLEQALAVCRQRGISDVWLMANHENATAIAFYQRHGFQHSGSKLFELGSERHENFIFHRSV